MLPRAGDFRKTPPFFKPLTICENGMNVYIIEIRKKASEPPEMMLRAKKRQKTGQKTAVAPPSIRLWILKRDNQTGALLRLQSCTPFDPLVDTETKIYTDGSCLGNPLHPLRSACGY
jgi:hypothetical protein